MTTLPSLRRKRLLVGAVLILSLGVSIAANVGHAQDNWPSRLIAAWPPFALWLAIEIVVHIPVDKPWVAWLRRAFTGLVAVVAAVLSYGHMRAVAGQYGEGDSAWLWPLSVDGLVIVASVGLVELSGRIRAAEKTGSATVPETESDTAGQAETGGEDAETSGETVPETPLSELAPREAARYGWRESGEAEKPFDNDQRSRVVRWLSQRGRSQDNVRKAVYAVASEFETPETDRRLELVAPMEGKG